MADRFRADIDGESKPPVVRLVGDIDRDAADQLDVVTSDVLARSPETVVLDFSSTGYINSTGIALIVGVLARARAAGVSLEAAGLSEHYRHVFEITRLSDFVTIRDESAVAHDSESTDKDREGGIEP